jgi:hypothetical protein
MARKQRALSERVHRIRNGKGAVHYTPRVVVKFRDAVQLPYQDGTEKYVEAQRIGPWKELAARHPGIRMRRLFNSVTPTKLAEMVEQARNRDRTYKPPNFFTYFVVDCPAADADRLARDLREWPSVENAYFDPPGTDPLVNAADDPRSPNQGYVDAAPDGIDAEFAWTFPGGDGAGQNFIDLEQGWTLNHEDLNAQGATLLFGTLVNTSRPHGTAVLGEVCAVDNALGGVGIATHLASVNVVSHSGNLNTIPNAIAAAIATLPFGGVLLLEVQVQASPLPAETVQANFDAIRLATALGIVVVEAAGNGGNDLDTFTMGGQQVLNRASAAFQDSGAIMVGAASSAAPHTRLGFSNFGSRIDCYAWGENVDTSSSTATMPFSTTAYTGTFNGTSSASPIITGASLLVQGLAQASLGYRFSPRQVRALLSDPATGTASSNPAMDRIGVMPNLRAILNGNILGLAPDVYLRDFVGDTGDPHAGAISASPDVILRTALEPSPQAAFGEGSGTENSQTLGFEAEAGQDNFIYVRVRNRGGSDAAQCDGDGVLGAGRDAADTEPVDARRNDDDRECAGWKRAHGVAGHHVAAGPDSGDRALLFRRAHRHGRRSGARACRALRLEHVSNVHPQQQQRHVAELQRRRHQSRSLVGSGVRGAAVPCTGHAGSSTGHEPRDRREAAGRCTSRTRSAAPTDGGCRGTADLQGRQEAWCRAAAGESVRAFPARSGRVPGEVHQRDAAARAHSQGPSRSSLRSVRASAVRGTGSGPSHVATRSAGEEEEETVHACEDDRQERGAIRSISARSSRVRDQVTAAAFARI